MTTLYHPRPERWPQFTLRGLFVVVTLAALLMPWAVTAWQHWREPPSPYYQTDGNANYAHPGPRMPVSEEAAAIREFQATK